MNPWDAPMPQALVDFEITGLENVNDAALSDLHKMELVGYGVNAVNGDLESPFYLMEIPSHMNIPANDYAWASWDGDGPYEMWHDLFVRDIDDMESGQGTSAANVNDDDVEVYSDNHGIAGVIADAIDEDGSVTIVATAEYPASLKRGKYPPVKSDEITIEWGIVEFDPDFEGIPRNCAEVEGCSVEFTNMTTGATTPYKYATWDFGDGTTPVQQSGAQAQAGQTITHQYAKAGVFDITLTMEDAEGVVAYQIEFDYIVVGEGGAGNTATWSFDNPGCFPKHLPDNYFGSVPLGSLTNVPSEVQGVYYNNEGTWEFWAPGAPNTTLDTLVGGLFADYMTCVTTATSWDIPLP
jgi:hypothetical protein